MGDVHGVGKAKLEKYGARFLAAIGDHVPGSDAPSASRASRRTRLLIPRISSGALLSPSKGALVRGRRVKLIRPWYNDPGSENRYP